MRIHKRETCDKSKSRAFGDARVRAEKKAETRENRGAFQPERKTKEKKDELASEDSLLSRRLHAIRLGNVTREFLLRVDRLQLRKTLTTVNHRQRYVVFPDERLRVFNEVVGNVATVGHDPVFRERSFAIGDDGEGRLVVTHVVDEPGVAQNCGHEASLPGRGEFNRLLSKTVRFVEIDGRRVPDRMPLIGSRYVASRGAFDDETGRIEIIDDGLRDRNLTGAEIGVSERIADVS